MSVKVSIERGRHHDIGRTMPVMRAAFDAEFGEAWTAAQCASALAMPGAWLHLAMNDGAVVGFALARRVLDETELLLLAVDASFRRYGIGRLLTEAVLSEARAEGGRSLFVEVRANNPARQFYDRLGFIQTGYRKNYYRGVSGLYNDAVTLTCQL